MSDIELDNAVREYDAQCDKLINDLNDAITQLNNTEWKVGLLYQEDMTRLLQEFSKQMETVRMLRSTQQPKQWITANPIYKYQERFNRLKKLVDLGEQNYRESWSIDIGKLAKHKNFIIAMLILIILAWLYISYTPNSPNSSNFGTSSASNTPDPAKLTESMLRYST